MNPIQAQTTEPNIGATFVDMHVNSSYPPGFESTPSTAGVFEYNGTIPTIGSLFNNTYNPDFFTSSTTPIPQLEGVDYKTSKPFIYLSNAGWKLEAIETASFIF